MLEEREGVSVLSIKGVVDRHTASSFRSYLDEILGEGRKLILVDCRHLEYVSSVGIRVLAASVETFRQAGGDMRFCRVLPRIREIIDMVGLAPLLIIYDTIMEGVLAVKGS